jgi:lysozyme family protein
LSAPAFADVSAKYTKYWQHAEIIPARLTSITAAAKRVLANKDRYVSIEKSTGIPWFLVGCLHLREANCSFNCHLHNGDSLKARTHQVPAGRPAKGNPPFTWEESALDALTMPPHALHLVKDWSVERFAYEAEKYNGWGYWQKRRESPYDWAGIDDEDKPGWQELASGKYVRDHVFDPSVIDSQPGVMSVLKVLMQLDPTVGFSGRASTTSTPATVPPAPESAPTASPVAPVPAPAAQQPSWGQTLVNIFVALLKGLVKKP